MYLIVFDLDLIRIFFNGNHRNAMKMNERVAKMVISQSNTYLYSHEGDTQYDKICRILLSTPTQASCFTLETDVSHGMLKFEPFGNLYFGCFKEGSFDNHLFKLNPSVPGRVWRRSVNKAGITTGFASTNHVIISGTGVNQL